MICPTAHLRPYVSIIRNAIPFIRPYGSIKSKDGFFILYIYIYIKSSFHFGGCPLKNPFIFVHPQPPKKRAFGIAVEKYFLKNFNFNFILL